jgi:diguanylate cyclase (GGDEF)-like protein
LGYNTNEQWLKVTDMDAEKLKKLLDIGRQMAEKRELDPLLKSAMSLALKFVGAEYGYLVLPDDDELVFRVGQDKDGNALQKPQGQISRTIFDKVIQSGEGIITADALNSIDTTSVFELQIRSVLCVPLISRGEILGAVYVENRTVSNLFKEEDLELLEYFSAQAAVSIENAMLNQELEARVEARNIELAHANAKLQELAITDALTGVFNRRHFFRLAERELARAQRYEAPLSAMMLDLDHFKRINDHYGHLIGDRVLQVVAECIQENIREFDILGRYGGEEFAFILPNTGLSGACEIANRILEMIESQVVQGDRGEVSITASLGVAHLADVSEISIEELLDYADQALYAAKKAGRNRVKVWEGK